jgi:nitrate/TMAO reductase-like tetraheme cytochrome c subunit
MPIGTILRLLMSGTVVKVGGIVIALLIILLLSMETDAEEQRVRSPTERATAAQATRVNSTCLKCHRTATSYVVSEWQRSKHYENSVGCFDCHGSDASNPAAYEHHGQTISALVSPNQCARCHADVVQEYEGSIHAKSGLIAQAGTSLGGGSYWNVAASVLGWIPWDFAHGMLKKPGEVVTLGDRPITYQDKPVADKFWPDLKNNPALRWGSYPKGLDQAQKNGERLHPSLR